MLLSSPCGIHCAAPMPRFCGMPFCEAAAPCLVVALSRLQVSTEVPGNSDPVLVLLGYLRRQVASPAVLIACSAAAYRSVNLPAAASFGCGRSNLSSVSPAASEGAVRASPVPRAAPAAPSAPAKIPDSKTLCSYTGMGLARATCASGCSCRPSWIDGFWDSPVSLTQMHAFQVRWHACCSQSR